MLRTSGFQARPNSIEARQARCCYTELVFRRELEGNCIDILLLACLHKLYIWHGGQTTIKPKDITDNVHSCQMWEKTQDNYIGGMGLEAPQSQPWNRLLWSCQLNFLLCHYGPKLHSALTSQSWKQIWFKLSSSSKIQFTLNFMCLG